MNIISSGTNSFIYSCLHATTSGLDEIHSCSRMELIGSDKLCIILSLFFSYVTVVTSYVAIDKECSEKALETFPKNREGYHFNVKGKLTSVETRSRMSSKVGNWTEYHCKFYFNNFCYSS